MAWLLPQKGKPLCALRANKERQVDSIVYLSGNESSLALESAVCAYVLAYEEVLDKVELIFVPAQCASSPFRNVLGFDVAICDTPPEQISHVTLPAIHMRDEQRVISGLSSIVRYILLRNEKTEILGFRAACLASCAQVSLWTAFCERDMPATALSILSQQIHRPAEFPQSLLVLENQLRQPVRTHNAKHLKRILKVDELSHHFVEGYVITLADLVLFLPVHLILKKLQRHFSFERTIPKVVEWHKRMLALHETKLQLSAFLSLTVDPETAIGNDVAELTELGELTLPKECLYSRSKLNTRLSIKNKDATTLLDMLAQHYPSHFEVHHRFGEAVNWDELPENVRPESGSLPPDRIRRKRQQISNVVNAVLSIAQEEPMTIVDFCSGGGHVGIAVAYLLPKCQVYLIENKNESMLKARERVQRLRLENVWFYQCNLDQFNGNFELAVALHACGGATDLVIKKCLKANASLVCVPCCYGSIGNKTANHSVLRAILDEGGKQAYEELCRLADRNESPEGDFCMECVDTDRACFIRERGYSVELTKLVPLNCTPKNNLIVARRLKSPEVSWNDQYCTRIPSSDVQANSC